METGAGALIATVITAEASKLPVPRDSFALPIARARAAGCPSGRGRDAIAAARASWPRLLGVGESALREKRLDAFFGVTVAGRVWRERCDLHGCVNLKGFA